MEPPRDCGDCGAKPGELHQLGCDLERCALCGRQLIGCGCVYEANGMDEMLLEEQYPEIFEHGPTEDMYPPFDALVEAAGGRVPWEGCYPGTRECEELGWYSRWVSEATGEPIDHGSDERGRWARCAAGDPGAGPDLNRLGERASWDPKTRRYVVRRPA